MARQNPPTGRATPNPERLAQVGRPPGCSLVYSLPFWDLGVHGWFMGVHPTKNSHSEAAHLVSRLHDAGIDAEAQRG